MRTHVTDLLRLDEPMNYKLDLYTQYTVLRSPVFAGTLLPTAKLVLVKLDICLLHVQTQTPTPKFASDCPTHRTTVQG